MNSGNRGTTNCLHYGVMRLCRCKTWIIGTLYPSVVFISNKRLTIGSLPPNYSSVPGSSVLILFCQYVCKTVCHVFTHPNKLL